MYYLLPQSTNLHLFKIRIQKQMGGTGLGYCKVSHNVVFIILLVQIFCLKCILSFCKFKFFIFIILQVYFIKYSKNLIISRVIILQVSNLKILAGKTYHFAGLSFCRFHFLLFRRVESIIFLGYHFPG